MEGLKEGVDSSAAFFHGLGKMLLSNLRRVRTLLPVFLRSSHFHIPTHSRISHSSSNAPQFLNAEFGTSLCSLLLQRSSRNYSNAGKNGKGGEEDPFGGRKAEEKSNAKGEGSSLNDLWDFSGQGEGFGGSTGGEWDEFGSGEGENVDWNSIEPDGAPFSGSPPEEKLEGFAEGDWKESHDGEATKEKDWADSTADWPAESSFEPSKSGDGSLEERQGVESKRGISDEWATAEGYEPWGFEEGVFPQEDTAKDGIPAQTQDLQVKSPGESNAEAESELEKEEKQLKAVLEGPNRAFGDLIAASGITETQLESLILMKDVEGIEGLPPLRDLEDARLERMERKSTRGEYERKRQEEIARARVRQVDEKGRAYGTGRRKCSAARVWIQPGDGRFIVNDKSFDAYFPQLEHRVDLLQPFVQTKTLGLWDIVSTVKGGGVSGQVGAIRLGISRALQNWEPGLRTYLRSAGLLTRDPRMVERKKPGKAKARKSFQWVKR